MVAAETPLHSWSQCWSCWSGFEMVQLWLILWIPLALHRQVVLTQIELQSLEGKEEVGGQTMRVGCRKKKKSVELSKMRYLIMVAGQSKLLINR